MTSKKKKHVVGQRSTQKKIALARKLTYENMRFYSVSSIRGVTYDGFDLIPKLLYGKVAIRLIEEIKQELRTIPRTFYFWVGLFYYNADGDIECCSEVFSENELTVPLIDVWLTPRIQEWIDSLDVMVQGYAFIGTPNPDYDLEQHDDFVDFFIEKGVVNAERANALYQIAQLEKITRRE